MPALTSDEFISDYTPKFGFCIVQPADPPESKGLIYLVERYRPQQGWGVVQMMGGYGVHPGFDEGDLVVYDRYVARDMEWYDRCLLSIVHQADVIARLDGEPGSYRVVPLGVFVAIRPTEKETESSGGILLPERRFLTAHPCESESYSLDRHEPYTGGTVLAMGDDDDTLSVGDYVHFEPDEAHQVTIRGEKTLLIDRRFILCIEIPT